MKAIRQRIYSFAVLTGVFLMTCLVIIIYRFLTYEEEVQMLLAVTFAGSGFSASLWIREYYNLKTARLILDNQILHIRPVVINNMVCDGGEADESKGIEVFVSVFGILLDSKIIKFNQDSIRLKEVEIGRDFISLTYGTDKRVQNARLLHAEIDSRELAGIVEKFRHETGIEPTLVN